MHFKSISKTLQTILLLTVALTALSLERVLLFFLNREYFLTLSNETIFSSFIMGVRVDTATILTFSIIFLLPLFYINRYRKIFSYLWLLVLIVIFTINLGDIFYFPYVHRHISNELSLLTNDLGFFFDVINSYLLELLLYLFSILSLFFVWRAITNIEIREQSFPISQRVVHSLLIIFLLFLGIRGKLEGKPFSLSDTFVDGTVTSANLSLNGVYSMYRGGDKKERNYMESKEALKITKEFLESNQTIFTSSSEFPLERSYIHNSSIKKYNIVLLMVESLSSKYVDSFGDENYSVTPYLDKLFKEGVSFPNFYANGQRSIEGLTSILTGVPSISGIPNLGYGLEMTNFSYLGSILKESGYSTLGIQASKRSSFRIDNILKLSGFDEVYGAEDMREFIKNEKDISLPFDAVWDGNMLRFLSQKIESMKKPFLTFGFTASMHFPCKLPEQKYEIYPHDEFGIDGYLNLLNYFDTQLEEFIEDAKEKDWFKDTIFIITGDHTIGKGIGIEKSDFEHFRVPLILYAPHILEPKVIDRVGSQIDIIPTILDILKSKQKFSTISNSLFSKSSEEAILREGNRMILFNNGKWRDENSRTLRGVLQTLTELIRDNKISH